MNNLENLLRDFIEVAADIEPDGDIEEGVMRLYCIRYEEAPLAIELDLDIKCTIVYEQEATHFQPAECTIEYELLDFTYKMWWGDDEIESEDLEAHLEECLEKSINKTI
jgi:hypothetical protein